jgi:integrase
MFCGYTLYRAWQGMARGGNKMLSPRFPDTRELMEKEFVWDTQLSGFAKRTRNGKQTWIVQYRVGTQQRRMKIGDVAKVTQAQAREAARKMLAEVTLGKDPQGDKRKGREDAAHTLRSVAREYLMARKSGLRGSSYREHARYLGVDPYGDGKTRRNLTRYWAALHSRPVNAITRKDVAAQVTTFNRNSGTTAARRARSVLSATYAWAVGEGIADGNPVIGTNTPGQSAPRDRVLSDAELAAVWKAAPDTEYGTIVRLLILTGARRQEIGGLRESEIDREGRAVHIPKERVKNGCALDIPLSDLAWSLLPPPSEYEHLFGRDGPFIGWSRAKERLDAALGGSVAKFRLHDIRRSVATRLGDLAVTPHIVEAVLNHQGGHKAGVAGIYNRATYAKEVRAALLMWSDHVQSLVEGQARKIIPIRR